MIQSKVIATDAGEGDLKEVAHRANLHQRSNGEVPIDVVVGVEGQGEHRVMDRSSGEPQAAPESPTWFVCTGVWCPYGCAHAQDSQQQGGTDPS